MASAETLQLSAQASLSEAVRLRAELRASVESYVGALRRLGEPPERAVVLVKELADDAMHAVETTKVTARVDGRTLRDQIVRWSINAYYAAAP